MKEAQRGRKPKGGMPLEDVPDQRTEFGIPGEDTEQLAAAEADVAYRWAAGAAAGRHVLVAGCGHGHGAKIQLDAGAKTVVGTDPDPRAVEIATRLYGERIKFVQAESSALPLASASFDAVVCVDAQTAELAPEAAISELGRVLSADGVLLVSLPLAVPPPSASANGVHPSAPDALADMLATRFANSAVFRRRLAIAAAVAPADTDAGGWGELDRTGWLAGGESEDRSILLAASDGELPRLESLATLASFRDLRAHEETLEAWEERARRAEADGSAKHWELVAAREAQRRLRMRLHKLEHRPLRVISRVLRGKPAKLGPGPPLRASEVKPEHWD